MFYMHVLTFHSHRAPPHICSVRCPSGLAQSEGKWVRQAQQPGTETHEHSAGLSLQLQQTHKTRHTRTHTQRKLLITSGNSIIQKNNAELQMKIWWCWQRSDVCRGNSVCVCVCMLLAGVGGLVIKRHMVLFGREAASVMAYSLHHYPPTSLNLKSHSISYTCVKWPHAVRSPKSLTLPRLGPIPILSDDYITTDVRLSIAYALLLFIVAC